MKESKAFLWAMIGGIVAALLFPILGAAVQTYVLPTGSTGQRTEMLTNAPNRDEANRSSFSGTTAPSSPSVVAGQHWMDTTNDLLKFRNAANDAWRTILTSSSSILTSQLAVSASCAATYTGVRGWCLSDEGGAEIRSVTSDESSYTQVVVHADAKIAIIRSYSKVLNDGTGEAGSPINVFSCTVPGDSAVAGCSEGPGTSFVRTQIANEDLVAYNDVIIKTDSSGRIKTWCDKSSGTVTSFNCKWFVVGYMP